MTHVFQGLRVTAAGFGWLERSGQWTMSVPTRDAIRFYAVLAGDCWFEVPGQPRETLRRGGLLLLPHDAEHVLGRGPRSHGLACEPNWDLQRLVSSGVRTLATESEAMDRLLLVCGQLHIDHSHQQHWWSLLPARITTHVQGESLAWLEATLGFVAGEALADRPGAQSLMSRLSELMLLQVLRRYTESLGATEPMSWLAALAEPQIGSALALLHAESARAWTVEGLARKVGMSRSAFAARFTRLVGQPPLQYLTCVRMQQAACLLSDTSIASSAVAERVGYVSDTAFCKAFKRAFGRSPGAYRREQRWTRSLQAA